MIKRIVKLHFQKDKIEDFIKIYTENQHMIRKAQGCLHLELLQLEGDNSVLFTLSFWQKKEDLEAYLNSELFRSTWAEIKVLFAKKAEAWSANELKLINKD